MKYAEASGHFASLVKMIEEEISVKGTNKELDEKLIHVSKMNAVKMCLRPSTGL